MKKLILLSTLVMAMPLQMLAQDDDMYFVPTKANVEKANREKYGAPTQTYYSGSSRSVDEYNRAGSYYLPIAGDSAMQDVIDFSGVEGVYPDSTADFQLTRQMSRWDDYVPSQAYWDGYNDGRSDGWSLSWHSPWYYSSAYYPWYDSWYDPWYYRSSWYGWYDPWYYRPYYYGWGGWYGGGWYHRPYYTHQPVHRNHLDYARSGNRGGLGNRRSTATGVAASASRGSLGNRQTIGSSRNRSTVVGNRSNYGGVSSRRSSSSSASSYTPSRSSSIGSGSSSIGSSRSSSGGGSLGGARHSGGGSGSRSRR